MMGFNCRRSAANNFSIFPPNIQRLASRIQRFALKLWREHSAEIERRAAKYNGTILMIKRDHDITDEVATCT